MGDSNGYHGYWAVESENCSERRSFVDKDTEDTRTSLDKKDLRHKLRSASGNDGHFERPKDGISPLRSPKVSDSNNRSDRQSNSPNDVFSPRRRPFISRDRLNDHGEKSDSQRNNLNRNGPSPLRSPINPDQQSRNNYRGRFQRDRTARKEDESMSGSPNKKNRTSYTTSPSQGNLSMDSEEHRFRRRLNLPSDKDGDDETSVLNPEDEEDKITLGRREKEISYGKNTDSYKLYIATVPKEERNSNRTVHPKTPVKWRRCSRRNWDAQVRAWKKQLHRWAESNGQSEITSNSCPAEADVMDVAAKEDTEMEEAKENVQEEVLSNSDNDELDLNEEEDESFLEGFELDYDLSADITGEPVSAPVS